MTKPIVTEEMVEAAQQALRELDSLALDYLGRDAFRPMLEAALKVAPKLELTPEEERAYRYADQFGTSDVAISLLAIIDRLTGRSE